MAPKAPNTTSGIEAKNLSFPEPYKGFQANACRNAMCPSFEGEAMDWVKPSPELDSISKHLKEMRRTHIAEWKDISEEFRAYCEGLKF